MPNYVAFYGFDVVVSTGEGRVGILGGGGSSTYKFESADSLSARNEAWEHLKRLGTFKIQGRLAIGSPKLELLVEVKEEVPLN